jgi:hypothetical protein
VFGPHDELTQKLMIRLTGDIKFLEVSNCTVVVPFVEIRVPNTQYVNGSQIIVKDIFTMKFPNWEIFEFFVGTANVDSVVIANSSFAKLSVAATPLNASDSAPVVRIENNDMGFRVFNRTTRTVVADIRAAKLHLTNNSVSVRPSPRALPPSFRWLVSSTSVLTRWSGLWQTEIRPGWNRALRRRPTCTIPHRASP